MNDPSPLTIKRIFWGLAIALLVLATLGIILSKGKALSLRHQPSEATDKFDFKQGSFDRYIAYSQDQLRRARLNVATNAIIQNASPFALEPHTTCPRNTDGRYLNGIVLTHGLIASPYSMRPIGEYFQSRCFYVLGVLLPDHATRPGDFIKTRWQSWAETQHFATRALHKKAANVFLAGHSVGGELTLYEAALNPEVKGVVLFAPAMQVTPAARYAKPFTWLGQLFAPAAWFEVRPDRSNYRYESITFSAAAESYELIKATNTALKNNPLTVPVFTVASVEDNTISTDAILSFMAKQLNPHSKTLLYSQHPRPSSNKIKVIASSAPEHNILSLSHLGVMVPPNHPEYGRDGAYKSCLHYFGEQKKLSRCAAGARDFYGEVTKENLKRGLIERIAFNPFYNDLIAELDAFFQSITK